MAAIRRQHPAPEAGADMAVARRAAFEQTWPGVEVELRRWLAAHRVRPVDRDDYVQEVAERAFVADLPVHSPVDVLRWSLTVMRNLHIDRVRASGRVRVDNELPDDIAGRDNGTDVARQVAARLDLAVVAREISSWSPAQRQALLNDDGEGTRRTNAFYVTRHRLRSRLLAAIDGAAALWLGIWRRIDPADADRTSAMVLLPPAALACVVSLVLFEGGGTGAPRAERPPAAATSPAHGTHAGAPTGDNMVTAAHVSPAGGTQAPATRASNTPDTAPQERRTITPHVDERIEFDAPGDPYVEFDNGPSNEPLFCIAMPPEVQGVCIDPLN